MQLPARLLAEVIGCTASQSRPFGPDRRRAARVPAAMATAISRVRNGIAEPPILVTLGDIAAGGISLECPQPIRMGERFIVSLPRRGTDPLKIECIVTRWLRLAENRIVVGAIFDRLMETRDKSASQRPCRLVA